MAGLRFSTEESGVLCVMMNGVSMMLTWCVVSLVFPTPLPLDAAHDMVRDLTPSGWIMVLVVEGERLHCLTAVILAGDMLIVTIARMQV